MTLDSNDERWFCDDDEEGPGANLADCTLPLKLGKTLTGVCILARSCVSSSRTCAALAHALM